ncbi:hypothetical protein CDAR_228221 [Caerostris darwini]|uniref:Uncharacterized protein n=1 Tax=Caerostris darwini TaxID=1538125 RepID=A0AAV4N772_9ARAC|nr:hypothetical protein CDAR_228221 [Caerostris darwini]
MHSCFFFKRNVPTSRRLQNWGYPNKNLLISFYALSVLELPCTLGNAKPSIESSSSGKMASSQKRSGWTRDRRAGSRKALTFDIAAPPDVIVGDRRKSRVPVLDEDLHIIAFINRYRLGFKYSDMFPH